VVAGWSWGGAAAGGGNDYCVVSHTCTYSDGDPANLTSVAVGAIGDTDKTGRLGVMYVRSILAQAGVVNNEVPGGEDHLAVDIAAIFPVGTVTLQVKAGVKKPNKDGDFSISTTKKWREKWAAARTPVFLVYVRLERKLPSEWIGHEELFTVLHARAHWVRVKNLSVTSAKVPVKNRLTVRTLDEWAEEFNKLFGEVTSQPEREPNKEHPGAVGATTATQLPFSGLKNPRDVAVDAKGDVYVTDSSNDRVMWLPAGAPAAATLPFTDLNDPRGIIVSPAGDVYVVDRGNDRVLFLAAGSTEAHALPFTGLNDPRGVAVDAAGGVVVTDTGNNRVMQLAAGSTEAHALPFTGVNDPHGVAVDSKGNVYVTDRGNAGIVELRPGATAAIPLPFTGLNDPQGVAVDGAGNVYVTDVGSSPVVKLVVG
jgi:sugar lactone lactonase YvrE